MCRNIFLNVLERVPEVGSRSDAAKCVNRAAPTARRQCSSIALTTTSFLMLLGGDGATPPRRGHGGRLASHGNEPRERTDEPRERTWVSVL